MKNLHQLHLKVQIMVEPDGDGYYAHSPLFPGVHAYDLTMKEAVAHALDGIVCTALTMVKHDLPLPCSHVRVDRAPVPPARIVTRNVTLPLHAMA